MDDGMKTAERRSDGQQTHEAILATATRLASIEGLEGLTFGRLARELGVTKSGVFAHFRSKQHLQRETVDAALEVFEFEVVAPGLSAPAGRARLQTLCGAYLSYIEREVFPGGCFLAQLLADYDARHGPIHDEVADGQRGWLGLLADQVTTGQGQGELNPDVDPEQLAFELYAPIELANFLYVLFRDPVIIERARVAVAATLERALPPNQDT
jgi:AcrR family transcriptional regulator